MTKKIATPGVVKKPRKRVPAYKYEQRRGDIGDMSAAFSEVESLAGECQEIVDNASEGLSNTQRIQTLGETADRLGNVSEVDVPECIASLVIDYSESVNTNKRRSPSRAVRMENAVTILQAGVDAAQGIIDETDNEDYDEDERAEIEEFINEIESVISEIEGAEFPGMFG